MKLGVCPAAAPAGPNRTPMAGGLAMGEPGSGARHRMRALLADMVFVSDSALGIGAVTGAGQRGGGNGISER